jgi:hypothetical protein
MGSFEIHSGTDRSWGRYRTKKRAEWMEPLRPNRPQLGYPTDFVLSLVLGLASLLRFAANSATTAFPCAKMEAGIGF